MPAMIARTLTAHSPNMPQKFGQRTFRLSSIAGQKSSRLSMSNGQVNVQIVIKIRPGITQNARPSTPSRETTMPPRNAGRNATENAENASSNFASSPRMRFRKNQNIPACITPKISGTFSTSEPTKHTPTASQNRWVSSAQLRLNDAPISTRGFRASTSFARASMLIVTGPEDGSGGGGG